MMKIADYCWLCDNDIVGYISWLLHENDFWLLLAKLEKMTLVGYISVTKAGYVSMMTIVGYVRKKSLVGYILMTKMTIVGYVRKDIKWLHVDVNG